MYPEKNLLAQEKSPYLLAHAQDPVHWRRWSEAALAEAQEQQKPILLSSGYAACHWCHVMARLCFRDPGIAGIMNRHFINIKLDREERPDIDALYMDALTALGQHGGWPLTMFLDSDGRAFWGGTFFPPRREGGRPGFDEILLAIARLYREEKAAVRARAENLMAALAAEGGEKAAGGIKLDSPFAPLAGFLAQLDWDNGGLRGGAKFPMIPVFDYLARAAARAGDSGEKEQAAKAGRGLLAAISQGGLHDPVGGGFFRYCVDAGWRVPHFEKMLYDNALILRFLAYAAAGGAAEERAIWRRLAEGTAGWLKSTMLTPDGFASSLDADSQDGEGGFYLLREDELDEALQGDAAFFRRFYYLHQSEGGGVLCEKARPPAGESAAGQNRLALLLNRLAAYRRQHKAPPPRDDKILADWNALAVEALAKASWLLDAPAMLVLAQSVWQKIWQRLWIGGQLYHCRHRRGAEILAFADDYAAAIAAALALFEASGEKTYHTAALTLFAALERGHWAEGRGYYASSAKAGDVPLRRLAIQDGPVASASGLMLSNLAKLTMLADAGDKQEVFAARAEALIACLARRRPHIALAGFYSGLADWRGRAAAHIHGAPDLLPVLRRLAFPGLALPTEKPVQPNRHEIILCRDTLCLPPAENEAGLTRQLADIAIL